VRTIDQLIEEDYLANTKAKVNQQFADAEVAIATTLTGDEQASLTGTLGIIKARLVAVLYEKGIDQHKLSTVRRIAGGRY
jgi:hypothetical protein